MKQLLTILTCLLITSCKPYIEFCDDKDPTVEPLDLSVEVGDCLGVAYRTDVVFTAPDCESDHIIYQDRAVAVSSDRLLSFGDGIFEDPPTLRILFLEEELDLPWEMQFYDHLAGGFNPDMRVHCQGMFDSNGTWVEGNLSSRLHITLNDCESNLPGAPLYAVVEGHVYSRGTETMIAGVQTGEDCRTHTYLEFLAPFIHPLAPPNYPPNHGKSPTGEN